eukprot:415458-Rhodomonas_salina.2
MSDTSRVALFYAYVHCVRLCPVRVVQLNPARIMDLYPMRVVWRALCSSVPERVLRACCAKSGTE